MTSGIIVILAALIPFVLDVISAKIAKDNSPQSQLDALNTQINRVIATHDNASATLLLNSLLSRVQDNTSSNTK